MIEILNRQVLKLNKNWQPVAFESVQHALEEMSDWNRVTGDWKRKGLNCTYPQLPDGSFDLKADPLNVAVVGWDEWIKLPIRPFDLYLTTGRGLRIRVPEEVIAPHYGKMPDRRPANNLKTVYDLYGRRCAYSGKLLTRKQASKDHVIPRGRGGRDELDNIVLADIEINNRKGDRLNSECGLPNPKIRKPRVMKAWETLRPHPDHPTWTFFLYIKE